MDVGHVPTLTTRSNIIFGKAIRPKVFGKWTKNPNKLENTQVPLE